MDEAKPKKKFPLALVLLIGIPIVLIATVLIVLVVILTDKNRNTHVKSDAQYAEIVKKNIIKGFEHTAETGKFTFSLEEDDINDLLGGAADALKSKYIDSIYYENKEDKHVFYVDLSGIPIKSRVALTTSIVEGEGSKINLNIDSIKVGKLNATNFVSKKLFEFTDTINKYFINSHIPVSLNKDKQLFVVDPLSYINSFPEGSTTSMFWEIIKENEDLLSVDKSKLGLTIDFSPFRSSADLSVKEYTDTLPDFSAELKQQIIDKFPSEAPGSDFIAYSISEEKFNQLLQKSLPTDKKEEITSTLTDKKATFNLVGTKTTFLPNDYMEVTTIYSLNGYLVDAHVQLEFADESDKYVDAQLEIKNDLEHPIILGSNRKMGSDGSKHLHSALTSTLRNTNENQETEFFHWDNTKQALTINLENMNSGFANPDIRNANKGLELNSTSKAFEFIVSKP